MLLFFCQCLKAYMAADRVMPPIVGRIEEKIWRVSV
jgi:hypothetical protein